MRASYTQLLLMVEFMERNGDLSKPSVGPRGRHFIQLKWKELTDLLNSDGSGVSRTEERWRKVWSDLKNNTKKKVAKINKAANGTGGGPALPICLNDIESRVIQIIGLRAATGMEVEEVGFQQTEKKDFVPRPIEYGDADKIVLDEIVIDADCKTPSTSGLNSICAPERQPTPPPPPSLATVEGSWKPPAPKKKKVDNIAKMFVESDRLTRENARERDLINEKLERERLRLREQELNLQAQWLEFMKEALNVIKLYLERDNK